MANFEFLKNQKEYILFSKRCDRSRKGLCDFSGHVSCWEQKSVGISCEMGVFCGRFYADAV